MTSYEPPPTEATAAALAILGRDTLPDTHDALKLLTYSLELPMLERGSGDTRELFSDNAPRSLRVFWDDGDDQWEAGWDYETKRRHEVVSSGAVESVEGLRDLLVWVEGERAALADREAG